MHPPGKLMKLHNQKNEQAAIVACSFFISVKLILRLTPLGYDTRSTTCYPVSIRLYQLQAKLKENDYERKV